MSDPHADAELRLGRPLTLAERNIDIIQLDRLLNVGKVRLYKDVDKEKRRAVNAHFRYRKPIQLHVTEQMRVTLRVLYVQGQRHARAELRKTGVRLASHADTVKLASHVDKLRGYLGTLQSKVVVKVAEAEPALSIGEVAEIVVQREVLRFPGALNVASQMVSGTVYSGIGSVFEENAGLFSGFMWTAVMDDNTCGPCEDGDGTEYTTWDEAMIDLPDGGPAVDCDGEGRCRCRLVPLV